MSKHWSENYLLTVNNDVEGWKIINMLKENQKLQLSGYIAVYLRK